MARKETQPTTELGKQLEKERDNRDLTIDAWCIELRVSRPQYLQWRTRSVELDLVNIRRIAVVMGVTLDTVFGWIEVDAPIIHAPSSWAQPHDWFRRPIDAFAERPILEAA